MAKAKTLALLLKEEIQALAPNLKQKDLNDLVRIAEGEDAEKKLRLILSDYKAAGKLNEPEINEWWKMLNAVRPLMKVIDIASDLNK